MLEELERLHAAYNECSEQLAMLLNVVKETGKPDIRIMARIKQINRHCDELLDRYMAAYKENYGENKRQDA